MDGRPSLQTMGGGLRADPFPTSQFHKRYERIARARERPLGELEQELAAEA